MVNIRLSFGFICTDENFSAVQTRPTPEQQVVIDTYRAAYEKAMGYQAHGFHYIPFPRRQGDGLRVASARKLELRNGRAGPRRTTELPRIRPI